VSSDERNQRKLEKKSPPCLLSLGIRRIFYSRLPSLITHGRTLITYSHTYKNGYIFFTILLREDESPH